MHLVTFGIAAALCMRLIRCQLISVPMNTIANFGQRVEFECSTNLTSPLRWDFATVNSTRFEYIYFNEEIMSNFSSGFKVDTSIKGRWSLVIDFADVTYAGTYRCLTTPNYVIGENEVFASAQLIVIDSDPVCGTNASIDDLVEGDYIQMQCTFDYSGNWIPVMEWTRSDGRNVDDDIHYTYGSRKVTLSLIRQLTSSDNGVTFACCINLNHTTADSRPVNAGETKATNIPSYQHSWNYSTNVLWYGPRNLTIMLIDEELKVGSRLECFAEANPAPNYKWNLVGENMSLNNGSIVVISESMISDEEQTLRCMATNYAAGQLRYSETTFTFNLTSITHSNGFNDRTSQMHLIIGIVSVGVVIFCLLIAILVYNMRNKVYKAGETPNALVQPIYAVVNKERNGYVSNAVVLPTGNGCKQEIPVYAEVKKREHGKKKTDSIFTVTSPTEEKPRQNYTGADGTQYEELSLIHDQRPNAVPVQQNPMFSLVDTYASIDHTLPVPPPPVPKRH